MQASEQAPRKVVDLSRAQMQGTRLDDAFMSQSEMPSPT